MVVPSLSPAVVSPAPRLESLFTVVDIYRVAKRIKGGRVLIASWKCPVSLEFMAKLEFNDNEISAFLRGPNPYSASMLNSDMTREWHGVDFETRKWTLPFDCTHDWLFRNILNDKFLRADVTLFRLDNSMSVSIARDLACRPHWGERYLPFDGQDAVFSSPEAERDAHSTLIARYISFGGMTELGPLLPQASSDEEPAWLANARRGEYQGRYLPSQADQAALSEISCFDFGLKSMEFAFYSGKFYGGFRGEAKMMTVLGGLCWE